MSVCPRAAAGPQTARGDIQLGQGAPGPWTGGLLSVLGAVCLALRTAGHAARGPIRGQWGGAACPAALGARPQRTMGSGEQCL